MDGESQRRTISLIVDENPRAKIFRNRNHHYSTMARVFITGSADGLGQLAAKALIAQGHQVVLHARNEKRAQEAFNNVPGAETVLRADLSNIDETMELASKVNTLGAFDAVIHNAGVYY